MDLTAIIAPELGNTCTHAFENIWFFLCNFRHCKTSTVQDFPVRESLGFLMQGVLAAEPAVLVHFQSVGVIFLIFLGIVVSLFAFAASEGNFDSHNGTSYSELEQSSEDAPARRREQYLPRAEGGACPSQKKAQQKSLRQR